MPKAKILILSFSPIARDPRVMRQVGLFQDEYALTVAGFGPSPNAAIEYVCLDYLPSQRIRFRRLRWELYLLTGLFERYYWSRTEVRLALTATRNQRFDVVIANDIVALPLAVRIAHGSPVLLDAHEYSPTEFEDRILWRVRYGRLYKHICHEYLPKCAAMSTVCEGVAAEYKRVFGAEPFVVENAPSLQSLVPSPTQEGLVKMIHHGAAIRSRRLELMIDMMQHLDQRFRLDFMLVGNDRRYVAELQLRAAADSRIRFLEPVPMPEICRATNPYDLGLFLLPPTNFNYRFALPNKLFEFVQARLGVAIGPSPEMARVVTTHNLGLVASSFEPSDLARRLNAMTHDQLCEYKRSAHAAATQLCFEAVASRWQSTVENLLAERKLTSAAS
ncbi:MAG: hypothetical protein ACK54C_07855 [Betaproteobacteria bacterium]|jgi:hypothetical protein